MKPTVPASVYVVVEVMKGIAVDAWVYRTERSATAKEKRCLRMLNMDEDDVQVFRCRLTKR